LADRQRAVVIGRIPVARSHEVLARNLTHCLQHGFVFHATGGDLVFDHRFARLAETGHRRLTSSKRRKPDDDGQQHDSNETGDEDHAPPARAQDDLALTGLLGSELALLLTRLTHPAISFTRSGPHLGHRGLADSPAGCPGGCRSAPLVAAPAEASGRERPAAGRGPASRAGSAAGLVSDWDRLA